MKTKQYDPTKKFIQVHRCVVTYELNGKKLGVNAAYLYSELARWFKTMKYDWFYKDANSFCHELGLSKAELNTAKNRLVDAGLIKHRIAKVFHQPYSGSTLSHYFVCSFVENGVLNKGRVVPDYDIDGIGSNDPGNKESSFPGKKESGIPGNKESEFPSITQQDNNNKTTQDIVGKPTDSKHKELMKLLESEHKRVRQETPIFMTKHAANMKRLLKDRSPDEIKTKIHSLANVAEFGTAWQKGLAINASILLNQWDSLPAAIQTNDNYEFAEAEAAIFGAKK
jgi:hypothetical protein